MNRFRRFDISQHDKVSPTERSPASGDANGPCLRITVNRSRSVITWWWFHIVDFRILISLAHLVKRVSWFMLSIRINMYIYIYMYIRIWEWEELLELDGVEIFAPLRSLNMSKCGRTRCCWLFFYVFDIIVWINMHLLYVVVSTCIYTSILRSYDDDCASLKACQKLLQDGSGIHHSAVMFLYGYVIIISCACLFGTFVTRSCSSVHNL